MGEIAHRRRARRGLRRHALALVGALGLMAGLLASPAARADAVVATRADGRDGAGFEALVPQALEGDATAAYQIAREFSDGAGRPEDLLEAARWYLRAARQGHPRAQSDLAMLLAKGRGVAQDYTRAYALFDLAAAGFEAGWRHDQAIEMRDMMAAFMSPVQRARARHLAATWKAEAGR
ncbi:MAG: tetratricopeptide repeat protein [Kiloniellaceae bacterium]